MSTQIKITYQNKDYTLEYTRQAVMIMESQGFVIEQVTTKPVTMIPMLFSGAFIKNHKGIKRKLVDEIYDSIPNKMGDDGLINVLIEMYAETINTLTDDGENRGNGAVWSVTRN